MRFECAQTRAFLAATEAVCGGCCGVAPAYNFLPESKTYIPVRRAFHFYTAIKQLSGKTGEEAGGYTKAAGAANINFAIVQKDALIQYTKHAAPKIIAPENNPDADAYVFGYRMVGIAKAYKNMLSGMYFSHDKA